MAPTIHKDPVKERKEPDKEKREQSLICKVKYSNTLPDIPFDPKSLIYPFESNRFIQYNPTSLERGYKHELLTENDLGITVDLVNLELYKPNPTDRLAPEDEYLLEDEVSAPTDAKRSRHHNKNVSWLRKTEYISTELTNKFKKTEKAESRIGFNMRRNFKEEEQHLYRDRQSQIDAIEATFQAARQPIKKHHSKPNVHAVEVLPLLPDFEIWRHPCAQVIFDNDPARKDRPVVEQVEEMHQAMIRGMVDESGDQFVAYFLPTDDTKRKRKRDIEEGMEYNPVEEYEYDLAREYNWNVKNKTMRGYEENYFFVLRENGVFYNELETRVRLSKRRKIGTAQPTNPSLSRTKLVVRHREFTDAELKGQAVRLNQLELDAEEEEEEEEGEEEEEEEAGSDKEMDVSEPKEKDGAERSEEEEEEEDDEKEKDEDEDSNQRTPPPKRKAPEEPDMASDSDLSSSMEEDEEDEEADQIKKPQENGATKERPQAADKESSEAESSSEEESDEDEEEEEEDEEKQPSKRQETISERAADEGDKKKASGDLESSSSSSEEEEDDDEEEEEGEEEEDAAKSAVERQKKDVLEIFGDESSDSSEEEETSPTPSPQKRPPARPAQSSESSDSESSSGEASD